ncbi:MAG: J domain-containing protein [Cyanobacteria bacterium K_DeepCast_35m_m1_288]|nr:J domain-containing protein [Cyanobacteria bacterium K_DeepCast_35m_m1_288]
MGESGSDKRRITLELSEDLLRWIDGLKSQMGFRNRGLIVEQLLRELVPDLDEEAEAQPDVSAGSLNGDRLVDADARSDEGPSLVDGNLDAKPKQAVAAAESSQASARGAATRAPAQELSSGSELGNRVGPGELDDNTAIVLIGSGEFSKRDQRRDSPRIADDAAARAGAALGVGIQLPGFVRRQARAVKRSLAEQARPTSEERNTGLALIPAEALQEALVRAQQHWLEIYGTPPSDTAQDAALTWLARDIWPQSDHSDGRPFSWGLAQQVLLGFAPGWTVGDPSLDRVITAAGILEDPFGGSSLAVRVPTLITRFVQRQRSKQKRSTSFEAIDQSMTVHGALRLLQLPTIADRPYTLKEIREAYREQAQSHHPDAGGSADAMRRLNEAYQFLKERYRQAA